METVTYIGAEGFLAGLGSQLDDIQASDPDLGENLVHAAAEMSDLAQYRDATDHLHFVVRKRG